MIQPTSHFISHIGFIGAAAFENRNHFTNGLYRWAKVSIYLFFFHHQTNKNISKKQKTFISLWFIWNIWLNFWTKNCLIRICKRIKSHFELYKVVRTAWERVDNSRSKKNEILSAWLQSGELRLCLKKKQQHEIDKQMFSAGDGRAECW